MLIDLPKDWRPADDGYARALRGLSIPATKNDVSWRPTRVYRGTYLAHINFESEISDLVMGKWPSFPATESDDWEVGGSWFNCYGVVDHWTQLPLVRLEADPRPLLVSLSHHTKAEQLETYGWRWHKWGPYLGVFREQAAAYEYLYDTPDVIEVFSYCVVELRPGVAGE